MPNYKVVITASGTGSRLGVLMNQTNKALLPLAGRPAIDYLLDRYDAAAPVVVTLGYLAAQIKDYLTSHHKNRRFTFVTVNPYEGPGSSLGFSLLQARHQLQCPFIFNACDTIVLEIIPVPQFNWAGHFLPPVGTDLNPYRTHRIEQAGAKLLGINEKGAVDFAPIHIGLTGIKDFKAFWKTLTSQQSIRAPDDISLSDVHVIDSMIKSGLSFRSLPFSTWLDTGNLAALNKAEENLSESFRKN